MASYGQERAGIVPDKAALARGWKLAPAVARPGRIFPRVRWFVVGLLFLAGVFINYLDRAACPLLPR